MECNASNPTPIPYNSLTSISHLPLIWEFSEVTEFIHNIMIWLLWVSWKCEDVGLWPLLWWGLDAIIWLATYHQLQAEANGNTALTTTHALKISLWSQWQCCHVYHGIYCPRLVNAAKGVCQFSVLKWVLLLYNMKGCVPSIIMCTNRGSAIEAICESGDSSPEQIREIILLYTAYLFSNNI